MNPESLIKMLNLIPHPTEGGYYREGYRATGRSSETGRSHSTAIYYLITSEHFSPLHRIPQDEMFHFYFGDPVEMIQIDAEGNLKEYQLGVDLAKGQRPQVLVPGGFLQGSRVLPGGKASLLGCTVSPGFEFEDFVLGNRKDLLELFPQHREQILRFTRDY